MIEICRVFLRLGALGFGGPVALIAMMEEETCQRRRWLTPEHFSEIYAICKILPGPVAVQMAIYLGTIRGAALGGIVAGMTFILPSFLLVLALAASYARVAGNSSMTQVFLLMQAASLSVILISTYKLAKPYLKKVESFFIGFASGWAIYLHPRIEPLIIFGFGLAGAAWASGFFKRSRPMSFAFFPVVLAQLFWVGFKAGEFVFGTGLAIVPLLEGEVVQKYHWLTHAQFMDGLSIGQVTPGPVTITMTFIGFLTHRWSGAVIATLGIYLPAFINVIIIVPRLWKKLKGHPAATGFVTYGFPAVIGGIAGTSIRLAQGTLIEPSSWVIFILVLVLGFLTRLPAWLLIPASGLAGYFVR